MFQILNRELLSQILNLELVSKEQAVTHPLRIFAYIDKTFLHLFF